DAPPAANVMGQRMASRTTQQSYMRLSLRYNHDWQTIPSSLCSLSSDRTNTGMFAVSAQVHTGSLQIPERARCQATPRRSVREMCLLLTSPFIEPVTTDAPLEP